MPDNWKIVRVFISSTFRDMQAERDHLVRFVFPRLREQLLPRRIHLVDVDLRWGVTSEQDASEVCREIITECRPRFLCVLGGRYGTIPEGKDRSITADEVHFGVLGAHRERVYPLFYFRHGAVSEAMNRTMRGIIRERRGSEKACKLALLKRAIRKTGIRPFLYKPRWNADEGRLSDLTAFGERVERDLLATIDDEFGAQPPAQLDEFAEENSAVEAFVEEHSQRFVLGSREAIFTALLAHTAATGLDGYVCLTGAPGSGKSALLACLSRHKELASRPSTLLISQFAGASAGSTDVRRTVRRLCHELKKGCSTITAAIPDEPEQLCAAFAEFLWQACTERRVVILLDGVDQFDTESDAAALRWLPEELPPNARFVVSAIGGPALDELRRRTGGPLEIPLQPLTAKDGQAIIEQFRQHYRKKFAPEQAELLLSKPDARMPLYLLAALEELRTLGTYEEINRRISELPPKTADLFGWILDRLENDDGLRDASGQRVGHRLVSEFARLLGASRHGLTEAELADLLETGDATGNLAALQLLLRHYLMRRGALVDFYHHQFRAAVEAKYLPSQEALAVVHRRLADYFETVEFGPRYLAELPWQLKAAGEKTRLVNCLTERLIFLALYTAGFQYDLVNYWSWLGAASDPAAAYREAVARFRSLSPEESTLGEFTHQAARFLAWMNFYPAAEELYRSAIELAGSACGVDDPITGSVKSNLAELLTRSGKYAEAGELYRSALRVADSHPEQERILGISLSNMCGWCFETGQSEEAQLLIRRALGVHTQCMGPDSEEVAVDRLNLARVLTELSRLEEAESLCRQALSYFRRTHIPAYPETARCRASLALILHRTRRAEEAQPLYIEALATFEKAANINPSELTGLRNNLAWMLMESSRWQPPGVFQP